MHIFENKPPPESRPCLLLKKVRGGGLFSGGYCINKLCYHYELYSNMPTLCQFFICVIEKFANPATFILHFIFVKTVKVTISSVQSLTQEKTISR